MTEHFRILVTGSGLVDEAQEYALSKRCVLETGHSSDTAEDLARRLKEFRPDGLIVRQGKITAAVMDAASSLKVICKHGVGTENIDIDAAASRGIPVMYTPDANFESVAQHSLAMILTLGRRITSQDRRIRRGLFDKRGYDGIELGDSTLGLIGFGRVARRLVELVQPLGIRVIAYHPSNRGDGSSSRVRSVESSDAVFSESDFVSLHCPLTPTTTGLVDRRSLALMNPHSFLINTARGGLVVEADLVDALKNDRLGGAALDVFEVEPPVEDNPLFLLDNVVLTPHVAGSSDKSLLNMGRSAVDNVVAFLRGEAVDPGSVVDPSDFRA